MTAGSTSTDLSDPRVAPDAGTGDVRLGEFDEIVRAAGFEHLAGTDEAGRGALAGPLVAAAVILPPGWVPEGLRDSKLMTPLQREEMYELITEHALSWAVRRVSSDRLDRIGLQRANLRALRESVAKLDVRPDYVAVDGYALSRLGVPSLRMIKGDNVCAAIAAASVLAKVSRDRSMVRMHRVNRAWRSYRFDLNKGYRSPVHLEALAELGPCPEHRRCFREVSQLRMPFEVDDPMGPHDLVDPEPVEGTLADDAVVRLDAPHVTPTEGSQP